MRFSIPYDPGCRNSGRITWRVTKGLSWNHFLSSPVLVQAWARCWGPRYYKENLSKAAAGCPTIIESRETSIRRQYLSFGFENRKWLGISNLDWETGPDSTITEHNYSKLSAEEPPTACWGPARKLTWVNGLEENMRWQEPEMPFSSKSTWKGGLER